MDQLSMRSLVLAMAGGLTTYVVLRHPSLGAALGIAIAVVALLNELLGRVASKRRQLGERACA